MLARAELNYPLEELQRRPQIHKKVVKRKNNLNALVKTLFIITAIIFLVISLFILSRYAQLTNSRFELTGLERKVVELEKEKLNLLGDLEDVKSSLKISEDAINKLGMIYPEEGQIVYVSINESIINQAEGFSITSQLKKVLNLFVFLF